MSAWLITATGTGVGKTFLTRGLGRALARRGEVLAIKPFETGVSAEGALDAAAIARASRTPQDLVDAAPWYRAVAPLAPLAATLEGEPPPQWAEIVAALRVLRARASWLLVEGAGGVLVPVDEEHDLVDLADALDAHVVMVAPDALGTLSHTRTALESLERRGVTPAAVVLRAVEPADRSAATNATILARYTDSPIVTFRATRDDDEALADESERSGLVDLVVAV